MGKQFYDEFNIVKKIFDEADEKLKFKLSNIILEGPGSTSIDKKYPTSNFGC